MVRFATPTFRSLLGRCALDDHSCELRVAHMNLVMVFEDLGTIHYGPSDSPSVSIGPPVLVMDHQPQLDRVLLEKKAWSGRICGYRGTQSLVRGSKSPAPRESGAVGGERWSIS